VGRVFTANESPPDQKILFNIGGEHLSHLIDAAQRVGNILIIIDKWAILHSRRSFERASARILDDV
jgi:hypothetical protein